MNEEQVSRMITDYGDAMPLYEPGPRWRRRAANPLIVAVASAIACASLFLLVPRAEAGGYHQMVSALEGVRTMEATTYHYKIDGTLEVVERDWLKGAKLAQEVHSSSSLHKVVVSTPDSVVFNYFDFQASTREPKTFDPFNGKKNALDWVIARDDLGNEDAQRIVRKLDSSPVNGRANYCLQIQIKEKDPKARNMIETVIVDSQTNLPTRCFLRDEEVGRQPYTSYTDYRFNIEVPDSLFEPRFSPVIDLPAQQAALVKKWQVAPLVKNEKSWILDAQVARDGTLYLLTAGHYAPSAVRGANGTSYLRVDDFKPGGVRGDTRTPDRLRTLGSEVRGVVFVPSEKSAKAETSVTVSSHPILHEEWFRVKLLPGPTDRVSVQARTCGRWPDYAYDLVLGDFFLQTDIACAETQAKACAERGDLDGAVQMWKDAAERVKRFTPSTAYRRLLPAEALLRKAGRIAEADDLLKVIAHDRSLDPNVAP